MAMVVVVVVVIIKEENQILKDWLKMLNMDLVVKRGKRENDAASSADISGFSTRKMKGKSTSRPGKSKRSRRH